MHIFEIISRLCTQPCANVNYTVEIHSQLKVVHYNENRARLLRLFFLRLEQSPHGDSLKCYPKDQRSYEKDQQHEGSEKLISI